MLKHTIKRSIYSVQLQHQTALLRTLQTNDIPQLHNEINKAQQCLGSNIPLAASVMGMQELVDSPHFQTMVAKQSRFVRAFLKSKHPLVGVTKNVMSNVAPSTCQNHENAAKHPVPLPFRGIIVAMIGAIFKPDDKKVLSIAEINGLISAGMNIHRNILPQITQTGQDKVILSTANKLAVLVGDVLLAKANSLTAELENPAAAAKISEMLSEVSQMSVDRAHDHSTVLWRECGETVVLVAGGSSEEYEVIGEFIENIGLSYVALVENDYNSAYEKKQQALASLDKLEFHRHQMADKINLLRSLTQAFLPIDWISPEVVRN